MISLLTKLTKPFYRNLIDWLDEAITHELSMLVIKGSAVVFTLIFLIRGT
jgi:hypothetical protein